MDVRKPVVAGQFYPKEGESCLKACKHHLQAISVDFPEDKSFVGGVVPHAGWVFSGDCVGLFFNLLQARRSDVETFVLFGAAHRYGGQSPLVGFESAWWTPLGDIEVDQVLLQAGLEAQLWAQDEQAHRGEHSIEVILPFIKLCYSNAKILPILSPPTRMALACGAGLSRLISSETVVLLASTDLTHYGPSYGFMPQGKEGWTWARDHNDNAFLESVTQLDGVSVLSQAQENYSACGAGAVAGAVSCAQAWGASSGTVLVHTTSNEVLKKKTGQCSSDSVGYATVVF